MQAFKIGTLERHPVACCGFLVKHFQRQQDTINKTHDSICIHKYCKCLYVLSYFSLCILTIHIEFVQMCYFHHDSAVDKVFLVHLFNLWYKLFKALCSVSIDPKLKYVINICHTTLN